MPDTTELNRQITTLLTPLVRTDTQRISLLIQAFGDDHPLIAHIDLSGDTATFLTNLLATLDAYGHIRSETPALVALLQEVQKQFGIDKRNQIDTILAQLRSLSPVTAPLPAAPRFPYERNPYFTGREPELAKLEQVLVVNQAAALTPPQALIGLGGIGKTQTAVEFYYRHKDSYPHTFWVDSEQEETLRTGFVHILRQVAPHLVQADNELASVEAAKHWLATNTGWLLILDNADNVPQTRPYLPPQGKGAVLITSRTQSWGSLAQRIDIAKLSEDEGATLLLRRAERIKPTETVSQAPAGDQFAARALSQLVDGLALALDQAGAYIAGNRKAVAAYLELYRQRGKELRARQTKESPTAHASVAVTYSLTLEKVRETHPAAALLLQYSALLTPEPIPETIFVKGAKALTEPLSTIAQDEIGWDEALGALHNSSLLERSPDTATFSLHRIVQEVIQDTMTEKVQKQYINALFQAMIDADPGRDYAQWAECERLLPHWRVIDQYIKKYNIQSEQAASILRMTGRYLGGRALYSEATPFLERALQIRETVLGKDHPETAKCLHNLAMLYYRQGKFDQAEPLYLRALQIREAVLGTEHPHLAGTLNDLAILYDNQGKFDQAEPLHLRALQIRETVRGKDHPDTAQSLNDLAVMYDNQGKFDQAEPLHLRALQIRETVRGKDHPDTAQSLDNLAILYADQGKFDQAEPLYLRALQIRETVLGKDHPYLADSLDNLAILYADQGKFDQAEPLHLRALQIREAVLGTEHPHLAHSLNNLAAMYDNQGKYDQAEPLYLRALQIFETVLGTEHPSTMRTRSNLNNLRSRRSREKN